MKTIEMKTSDLEGAPLDWSVAKADGWDFSKEFYRIMVQGYCPSTDWSQGGPLIEKHGIRVSKDIAPDMGGKDWRADVMGRYNGLPKATSPLIALCRAVVIHELGDTVQVPADLIGGAA